jgi:hypothetical protein
MAWMPDDPKLVPLDYRGKRIPVPESLEAIRWRLRRIAFRAAVILLLTPITFYFGPNMILFGKLTWLTPADFVLTVQRDCVPTVRAMKEYQRDFGHLPEKMEDLVPKYLRAFPDGNQLVTNGSFAQFEGPGHQMITYEFGPGREGWSVLGGYTRGPIPLPPVTIGPATRSALPPT